MNSTFLVRYKINWPPSIASTDTHHYAVRFPGDVLWPWLAIFLSTTISSSTFRRNSSTCVRLSSAICLALSALFWQAISLSQALWKLGLSAVEPGNSVAPCPLVRGANVHITVVRNTTLMAIFHVLYSALLSDDVAKHGVELTLGTATPSPSVALTFPPSRLRSGGRSSRIPRRQRLFRPWERPALSVAPTRPTSLADHRHCTNRSDNDVKSGPAAKVGAFCQAARWLSLHALYDESPQYWSMPLFSHRSADHFV
ncbi:hypothetical protein AeRB84_004069 [Aphanomyces euteiches]|nr:hypothetical protein AeRB84_004069 [Aphanomyces euteiches]